MVNEIKEEVYLSSGNGVSIPVLMSVNTLSLDNSFILSIILTDLTILHENQEELKSKARELEQKNTELQSVNKELAFQNVEKEKRAVDLIILSVDLKAQQKELRKANEELHEKAQLLQRQDEKMMAINDQLLRLNQDLEKRVFERTRELENLNLELKDLNLSKDKFLSVISHDLRNPLTALLISSDALSHDTEDHIFDGIQPYIKVINRTSHKILDQLNELVDWAQLQREKTALHFEKLHLALGIDQSLELLRANALQKNIVLENKVPFSIYVNADILMLRSIVQNLVTNAIKYTPPNGLITVNAQRIDKMVEVSITDTGIGMKADVRKNLFTNSHAASVSGTNNEKGSGLGLILVKDFVAQHNGDMRAESELGKGTRIIFTLPVYMNGNPA